MNMLQKRSVIAVVAFIVGFSIGLFIFGWWLTPVQYTGAGPQDLLPQYQQIYIQTVADLYSHDLNQDNVRAAFAIWPDADQAICQMVQSATDQGQADRLTTIALILNGQGCTPEVLAPAEEGGASSNLLLICFVLLLVIALLAAAYLLIMRRGGGDGGDEEMADFPAPMTGGPTTMAGETGGDDRVATPIARFETRYSRGHDSYDDSFSIENSQGDFLGECGVGISESIGMEMPKNVTAFEVWLFDKNDIRTVTRVIMSEHAYNDEAIRAKLATKGEPILARPNETIVLETATLIINAEIGDLVYGSGTLPPNSFFEEFSIELSAWAKEGDFDAPDIQGHIDQMMDY
ncbi:MAG: hypothetical protein H6666_12990 [Ardenticatenaceae bacterium]|nr:hypothetical protein [Anaerolineales bacterium]MCB8918824.1 hypothetical protein [Ardenticatenaceae bacterium]